MLCVKSTWSDLLFSQCVLLTDMHTVLSYWTATALRPFEMSLLTVEVKVFITYRRRTHSPSSSQSITSHWDSRDGLRWWHLFWRWAFIAIDLTPFTLPLWERVWERVSKSTSGGISNSLSPPGIKQPRPSRKQMQRQSVVNFTFAIVKGTGTWDNGHILANALR